MRALSILLVPLAVAACNETSRREAPKPAPSAVTAASTASASADASAPSDPSATAEITFVRDGKKVRTLSLSALDGVVTSETFTAFDPYYNKPKTYRALPLEGVLVYAFDTPADELVKLDYVLRARDGYTVPMPGSKLFEKGGYIAIADMEFPSWEPIGQQRANPAPFYVVWREPSQASLETYPRPWQLATIEIAPFDATYPHMVPTKTATDSPAMKGFHIFRASCVACHAINREGGRIGPDLNVPQSVVEYRPKEQIRAYIKNPRTFRYSTMPAHPSFTEADLDAIIAYFEAMKDRKYDPEAKNAAAH